MLHVFRKVPGLRPVILFAAAIMLLLPGRIAASIVPQTTQANAAKLEVAKPVERELGSGQSHAYQINLSSGQYLSLVVVQRGIDVAVQLLSVDGKPLFEQDGVKSKQGEEKIQYIAEAAGTYQINVRSVDKSAPSGKYEIKITEIKAATDKERDLMSADKLGSEMEQQYNSGKFKDALATGERILAIYEKQSSPDSEKVADALDNLCQIHYRLNELDKAEARGQRALEIREKIFSKDSPELTNPLNRLGNIYKTKADYRKAEATYLRALAINEKNDPTSLSTGDTCNELGVFYQDTGNYKKAETYLTRALEIREKKLSTTDPAKAATLSSAVATSVSNIGSFYENGADFVKAEQYYRRALEMDEKNLPPDHPYIAISLGKLAKVYKSKNDFAKAEPLYLRSLAILENNKNIARDDQRITTTLNNIGAMYVAKKEYDKAETYFLRALEIYEKKYKDQKGNVSFATNLTNLADLYRTKKDYEKAEAFSRRALQMREALLGADNSFTASSLVALARVYYDQRDYHKAEPLYLRALKVNETTLGPEHRSVAEPLSDLAMNSYAIGETGKAIDYQARANELIEKDLAVNIASGSERQKILYLRQSANASDFTIFLNQQAALTDAKARRVALRMILQRKGRALDIMNDSIAVLRKRAQPEDRALLDQLESARSQLAAVSLQSPRPGAETQYRENLKKIEEEVERLENQVSQRSAEFRAASVPVTIEAVQKALPAGTSLVEFAQYRPFDPKAPIKSPGQFGEPHYVAYILTNRGEPAFVELGDAKAINDRIAKYRQIFDEFRKSSRDRTPAIVSLQNVKRQARLIDKQVMQPVRRLLGNSRRILLSPDGYLNLIPFAALVDERGRYLVSRYQFSYLTSGRDLLRLQTHVPSKQMPVIMADIDFDNAAGTGGKKETSTTSGNTRLLERTDENDPSYGPKLAGVQFKPLRRLKATAQEAMSLESILKETNLLMKEKATEAALKQVSGPSILHIATHGFFLDETATKIPDNPLGAVRIAAKRNNDEAVALDNPLVRSGLFLAGANRGQSGENGGTMTALEAAGLDLWGTKLVVLSACETGLGAVTNGEGIYGLRRALVLAGSETQVMSLWSVSDKGTSELMIDYYRRLKAGEGRSEALRNAQLHMLTDAKRRHPYYWAAFIQSGEWANLDGKR